VSRDARFDCAVGVLAARLPGLDDGTRAEVAATARAGARAGGAGNRVAELASLAGLLLELAARRQTRGRRGRIWLQGAAAGLAYGVATTAILAVLGPTPLAVTVAVTVVAVVLLPCGALLLARLDPRAAVAVLVFWIWRLALTNLDAAGAALGAWSTGADDGALLVRWCAMCAGIAVAWHVTRRSTRHDAAI
jgi:hypothetical protein